MKKILASLLVVMSLFVGFKNSIDTMNAFNNGLLDKEQVAVSGDEKDPQILSIRLDRTL